ncbi:MAG TPA: IS1 family transposase [Bacteroidales bacterium]|nr:IS1 family transposase [Bacteroidales bacterium]HQB21959.1 IS1 family transposase [Bacteroidales bacterium]
MECRFCNGICIKKGKRKGVQRYRCKDCGRYQQKEYTKAIIPVEKYILVQRLNNEGCGISSISRLLGISKSSVQRLIERIALQLKMPELSETGQSYEIDEVRTYCGNKKNECWIIYAINKASGTVVDFCVGRRTKENLKKITDSVLKLKPQKVYTDKLNIYSSLIPKAIHKVFEYCINKIERKNLSLRTHLKRMSRKTICFNKSTSMLENCVKIYMVV